MRIAIDTNRYVDFCKGDPKVLEAMRQAEEIQIPFIVVGELRAGFRGGAKGQENERFLNQFLHSRRVHILYADDQTMHHYANLFFQLRKQGTPIPTNDLWIASLVAQHSLLLFARDQHFDHLPQLPRLRIEQS